MAETNPPIGSSAWMEKMSRQEGELNAAKESRRPKVQENLDWEATEREDKTRRANHPAGHIRTGVPVGTSTVGESSRGKDPGR